MGVYKFILKTMATQNLTNPDTSGIVGLAQFIDRELESKGCSDYEVERTWGLKRNALRNIRKGNCPGADKLVKIRKGLGVSWEDFGKLIDAQYGNSEIPEQEIENILKKKQLDPRDLEIIHIRERLKKLERKVENQNIKGDKMSESLKQLVQYFLDNAPQSEELEKEYNTIRQEFNFYPPFETVKEIAKHGLSGIPQSSEEAKNIVRVLKSFLDPNNLKGNIFDWLIAAQKDCPDLDILKEINEENGANNGKVN
jgi:transcriptional regulator with XRE-family HTH domain